MKKVFSFLCLSLCLALSFAFSGCDFGSGGSEKPAESGGENKLPQINNETDLTVYTPSPSDDITTEDETFYTSSSIDLVTEVNGNYSVGRPFTLDKENDNLRIYRNVYFYEDDYFLVLYYKSHASLGTVYAALSDSGDSAYAQVQYTKKGTPYQIDIVREGVYDLILDVSTFMIDMVYKSEIVTPVYEPIKSCELYVLTSSGSYTEMSFRAETNEYFVQKELPLNASVGFFSSSHNGHYKITAKRDLQNKYLYIDGERETQFYMLVGGVYNVYLNAATYELRLELLNPDTADYYCKFNGTELTSSSKPYLFEISVTVSDADVYGVYYELPRVLSKFGAYYALSPAENADKEIEFWNNSGYLYIKQAGSFVLEINLKDFTARVIPA